MPIYNNQALGQAFNKLASLFAPPSASDLAAYEQARALRQKGQISDWLFNNSSDPTASARSALLGIQTYGNTPAGFGMEDATKRYGYDQGLVGTRYTADVNARTELEKQKLADQGALARLYAAPVTVNEGQTTYLPAQTQAATGLDQVLGGMVKLSPGERAILPNNGGTLNGADKPLTDAEAQAKILLDLPQVDQRAKVLGDVPVEQVIMGGQPTIVRRPDAVGMRPFIKPDTADRPVTVGDALVDPLTGKVIYKGDAKPVVVGGTLVDPATGKPVYQAPSTTKPEVKNYRTPDGKLGTAVPSPDGKLVDTQTGAEIPAGSVTIGVNIQADNPEQAFGITAMKDAKNNVVNDDVSRALSIIEANPTLATGILGQVSSGIGGTPAKNLASLLDTVKANVGFDQLQAMRNASPTGGALGQVSDTENRLLQSVLGSLEQSQSPEALQYNLKRLSNTVNDIVHGPGNGPARYDLPSPGGAALGGRTAPPSGGQNVPTPQSQQEFDALPAGSLYRDPEDGKLYRK